METSDVLIDAFGRIEERVRVLCRDISESDLVYRPEPHANTIAWLLWHTSRGIDAQVMDIAGLEQVWTSQGWADRFDLPFDVAATGYGQTTEEVGAVRADAQLLSGYSTATHEAVVSYVQGIDAAELDRIVDTRWDPPVTAGVRLVSCIGDGLQHVGQAAYVLGMAQRENPR